MSQDRATPVDPARPDADPPDPRLAGAVDEAILGDVISMPDVQPDRVLGADPHDFASLYIRHRQSFGFLARRFLHDPRDVDEVVQETFLRLFLALPELQTELQALAWCRRTVTNLCIDRYRADQRRPRLIDLESLQDENLADEDEELTDPVIRAEDAAIVREALSLLSPLHRAALVKREIEEKSLPQIAAELGVPEQNVKHLLYRARRALRRLLLGTSVQPGVVGEGGDDRAVLARRLARSAHRIGALVLLIACLPFAASQLRSLSTDSAGRSSALTSPRQAAAPPATAFGQAYDAPDAPARTSPPGDVATSGAVPSGGGTTQVVPLGPPSSPRGRLDQLTQARERITRAVTRGSSRIDRRAPARAVGVVAQSGQRVGAVPSADPPTTDAVPNAATAQPPLSSNSVAPRLELRGEVPATGAPRISNETLTTMPLNALASTSVLTAPTVLGDFTLDQTLIQQADPANTVLEVAASFSSDGVTNVLGVAPGPTTVLTTPDGSLHVRLDGVVSSPTQALNAVKGISVELVLARDLVTVLEETVTLTVTDTTSAVVAVTEGPAVAAAVAPVEGTPEPVLSEAVAEEPTASP